MFLKHQRYEVTCAYISRIILKMVNTNGYSTKTPNYFLAGFFATGLLAVAFFAAAFLAAGLFPVFFAAGLFAALLAEPFPDFLAAGLLDAFSADFFTTFLTFAPSAPLPLLVEPFFTFFGVTFLLAVLPWRVR